MRTLLSLFSAIAALFGALPAAAQSAGNVFEQSTTDGLVVMEAENFGGNAATGTHQWIFVTDPAGFRGAGAMQADPNTGAGPNTGYSTASPRLDFRVFFRSTGTHYVWIRGRAPTTPSTGNNDSCHVGLNGAEIATSDRMSGWGDGWTWRNATMDTAVSTFTVATSGVHTVNLWMREDGFIADRILLTTNSAYNSVTNGGSQDGPAESPQIADERPGAPGTLTATASFDQVLLTWGAATNAETYEIRRRDDPAGTYATIATGVAATSYTDTSVVFGQGYCYEVLGVDSVFGAGPASNEACVTIPFPPPRTNDHSEGLFEDSCACGSSARLPALPIALLLVVAGMLSMCIRR